MSNNIGERVKVLRTSLDMTQQAFADKLGIKRGTIANYELGRNEPIDAVITLICREFKVNRIWLETGEGEMFAQLSRKEELALIFGDVLAGNSTAKNRFIEAAALLPD
jgi:transcriptional regulator with XRE-family HTH domain